MRRLSNIATRLPFVIAALLAFSSPAAGLVTVATHPTEFVQSLAEQQEQFVESGSSQADAALMTFGNLLGNVVLVTPAIDAISGENAAGQQLSAQDRGKACGQVAMGALLAAMSAEARLATLESKASSVVRTGSNAVYQSLDEAGHVNYVGLTNDLARRAAEQLRGQGLEINGIPGLQQLSRAPGFARPCWIICSCIVSWSRARGFAGRWSNAAFQWSGFQRKSDDGLERKAEGVET